MGDTLATKQFKNLQADEKGKGKFNSAEKIRKGNPSALEWFLEVLDAFKIKY